MNLKMQIETESKLRVVSRRSKEAESQLIAKKLIKLRLEKIIWRWWKTNFFIFKYSII